MKKKEITISDITCMSCVSKIEKQLYSNTSLDKITINKDNGLTLIEGEDIPRDNEIQNLLSEIGNYSLTPPKRNLFSSPYKPLIIIVFYLFAVTLAIEFNSGIFFFFTWMGNFMAGFFLLFSFFKIVDVPAFAKAYQSYDIIASKINWYGYIYPFIEFSLGISYLFFYDSVLTNLITAIIMFVGLIGVYRSVIQKTKIQCACLGTVFNLPMSYVTIIEDGVMLMMALFMLI